MIYLIKNGADVNAKNNDGNIALISASNRRHLEIVKLLIKNGADVNAKDNDGMTALMWTTGYFGDPSPEVIKLLIKNGADVNAEAKNGNTALTYGGNRGRP